MYPGPDLPNGTYGKLPGARASKWRPLFFRNTLFSPETCRFL